MHEQQSTLVAIAVRSRSVLALLPFLALLVSNVTLADSYASLPEADKIYVMRVCAPVQYQQDTAAYRNCVGRYTDAILTSNRTPVASLDFDEQFNVQQKCQQKGAIGSTEYRQCVDIEARSLEGISVADTSSLSYEEIYSARQNCTETQNAVRAYRQCVNNTVATLKATAAAQRGQDTPEIASTSQESPPASTLLSGNQAANINFVSDLTSNNDSSRSDSSNDLASVANDLATDAKDTLSVYSSSDELQSNTAETQAILASATAVRIDTVTNRNSPEPTLKIENAVADLSSTQEPLEIPFSEQSNNPVLGAAESDKIQPQNADPVSQQSVETDDLNPVSAENLQPEANQGFVQKLKSQFLSSLDGVAGIDRIILIAGLALPFCLIGFWLLMRRRTDEPEPYTPPAQSRSLADRVYTNSNPSTRESHPSASSDDFNKQMHFADQVDDLFTEDEDPEFDTSSGFTDDDASVFADDDSHRNTAGASSAVISPASTNNLNAIIVHHEKDIQLGLVIEFMIYWMAFTDERYDPELKIKIFAEPEPDDHNRIKRCVLSQDFNAFADAISWLQENASTEEREQVLKLLMALLVYEEGITPVQNTMLRFLSNTFGMTHNQFDALFQVAFGHALPPMPRPDKPTWWKKQSEDKILRWDARTVAQQSELVQARVKLGLPLHDELDSEHIIECHERAILRCQPKIFHLLGSHEQQLAEHQQVKFHNAFEVLMETSE